jgi:heme exporter protein D
VHLLPQEGIGSLNSQLNRKSAQFIADPTPVRFYALINQNQRDYYNGQTEYGYSGSLSTSSILINDGADLMITYGSLAIDRVTEKPDLNWVECLSSLGGAAGFVNLFYVLTVLIVNKTCCRSRKQKEKELARSQRRQAQKKRKRRKQSAKKSDMQRALLEQHDGDYSDADGKHHHGDGFEKSASMTSISQSDFPKSNSISADILAPIFGRPKSYRHQANSVLQFQSPTEGVPFISPTGESPVVVQIDKPHAPTVLSASDSEAEYDFVHAQSPTSVVALPTGSLNG